MLIAVELGADWPDGLDIERGVVRRVVAQSEGETPEAFAVRLGGLAGRLFSTGVELTSAVVACNERTDPSATLARRAMGAMLLERMGPSATLALAAGSRAGGRLRHALSALAIDLAAEAAANVTVQFGVERESPETASIRPRGVVAA
jgi:hypothetical protein